jgi:hypothetical protein
MNSKPKCDTYKNDNFICRKNYEEEMNILIKSNPYRYCELKYFENLCNIENNIYERNDNKINVNALYCGLHYILTIYDKLPITTQDIVIVDILNVFQNKSVLIYALCVIEFDESEITTIYQIINYEAVKENDFYTKKNNIFKKIMEHFYIDNSIVFFVGQGNETDYEMTTIESKIIGNNSTFYKISIPCYICVYESILNCAQNRIKNESDDVCSIFLYNKYLQKNNVVFWTYDNYNWFSGKKDTRIIQLNYSTSEPNKFQFIIADKKIEIPHSVADKDKFKNEDVLHQIITFDNNFTWNYDDTHKKYYYEKFCNIIKIKNNKGLINSIVDFYKQYNIKYIKNSSLDDPRATKLDVDAKPFVSRTPEFDVSRTPDFNPLTPEFYPLTPDLPFFDSQPPVLDISAKPYKPQTIKPRVISPPILDISATEFIPRGSSPLPISEQKKLDISAEPFNPNKYKNKYLKYKKKYIELKTILDI